MGLLLKKQSQKKKGRMKIMNNEELGNLIFPNAKPISYYEEKYPRRNLPEGAIVTRFAPSPTGFVHIGSLYQALISNKMAKQTKGIFFLRIEDTDQKREIEGGVSEIINSLNNFGISFDEGMIDDKNEKGEYGPYKQSLRKEIYQSYAKNLIEKGLAYPCFLTPEELEEMRKKQESLKIRPGCYGIWAKYRNLPSEQAIERIKNGENYIIRLKSMGNENRKIRHHDLIKGNVDFPENDQDIVIIKSDGLPTYHFAHAVDDHLMETNLVIRGDEWLSSIPIHIELFKTLGFKQPKYAHISPIMKEDNGAKRKISKRKDPEAAVSYYHEEGIPNEAVKEYLLNIANSSFENWRRGNKDANISEFQLELNKMSVSGAVFDMVKLLDVSKNVISKYTAMQIYEEALEWTKQYNHKLQAILENNPEYAKKVFNIERGNVKPRKDIAKWSDLQENIFYMYEELYHPNKKDYEFQKITNSEEIKEILQKYIANYYHQTDDKQQWFDKIKDLSEELGYAREVKEYKQTPETYKGHVGDISTVLRVALTSKSNTPDLYEIMQVLGKEVVEKRIQEIIQ